MRKNIADAMDQPQVIVQYLLSLIVLALGAISGIYLTAVLTGEDVSAGQTAYQRAQYILPPDIQKSRITFADSDIPLDRPEVAARVSEQINYLLMDRRATMMQWFDRMGVYGPLMRGALVEEKVPTDLFYLSVLLSDLLPNAKTKTGGVGWWALGSARDKKGSSAVPWVVTNDWDDRRDPVLSTRIACTILQGLLRKDRKTNWLFAICSYVDGADKIDAVVEKAAGFGYWDLVMPSYSETLIPRLTALKIIDTHRAFYGIDIPPLPPLAFDYLDRVKLQKDLPLYVVAKWCDTSARSMWELNPGVDPSTGLLAKPDKRSPSGFPLRVPKGMGPKVQQLLVKEGYVTN